MASKSLGPSEHDIVLAVLSKNIGSKLTCRVWNKSLSTHDDAEVALENDEDIFHVVSIFSTHYQYTIVCRKVEYIDSSHSLPLLLYNTLYFFVETCLEKPPCLFRKITRDGLRMRGDGSITNKNNENVPDIVKISLTFRRGPWLQESRAHKISGRSVSYIVLTPYSQRTCSKNTTSIKPCLFPRRWASWSTWRSEWLFQISAHMRFDVVDFSVHTFHIQL
jgi:hypothetical protein